MLTIPHPLGSIRPLTGYRCWLEWLPRAGAINVPAIDEEEAAHRFAESLFESCGMTHLSVCVEIAGTIVTFDIVPKHAVVYDVERRKS